MHDAQAAGIDRNADELLDERGYRHPANSPEPRAPVLLPYRPCSARRDAMMPSLNSRRSICTLLRSRRLIITSIEPPAVHIARSAASSSSDQPVSDAGNGEAGPSSRRSTRSTRADHCALVTLIQPPSSVAICRRSLVKARVEPRRASRLRRGTNRDPIPTPLSSPAKRCQI